VGCSAPCFRPWSIGDVPQSLWRITHGRVLSGKPGHVLSPKNGVIWTQSNTWFLGPTRVQIPNGISIGSPVFAQLTAERPYTLQWVTLCFENCSFPWQVLGLHLIHDSLSIPEPTTQTTSRLDQPFLHSSPQSATLRPLKLPLPTGILDPHLTHGSVDPLESSAQTSSKLVEPFLQGSLVYQTDRQTNWQTYRLRYSVGNNRPHLRT